MDDILNKYKCVIDIDIDTPVIDVIMYKPKIYKRILSKIKEGFKYSVYNNYITIKYLTMKSNFWILLYFDTEDYIKECIDLLKNILSENTEVEISFWKDMEKVNMKLGIKYHLEIFKCDIIDIDINKED